ncbi:uncharacterized protein LOC122502402 [Leptopilina heterotoma]|uniref:uncharacterized protein LOC122502402 n=1 Tax=Leptopilina heterotoma TaxID=63436 RepID=UPI001CA8B046|nr:uncharacterized protein LOC122502402 [Leptopilina heterotoma]
MSRGTIRGRRRLDVDRILSSARCLEEPEVDNLVCARHLFLNGRFPSQESLFTEDDIDKIRRSIASSPHLRLTDEEEKLLPRPEDPQVEIPGLVYQPICEPVEAGPSRPQFPPNHWVLEMKKQIASRAKTPSYWGKTKARRGKCGKCLQTGHAYHECPLHKRNQ